MDVWPLLVDPGFCTRLRKRSRVGVEVLPKVRIESVVLHYLDKSTTDASLLGRHLWAALEPALLPTLRPSVWQFLVAPRPEPPWVRVGTVLSLESRRVPPFFREPQQPQPHSCPVSSELLEPECKVVPP